MSEFWELLTGDLPFLRNALIVGAIASVPFGIVGSVVVTQRISSMAGAIGHAVLGGVGMALFFQRVLLWDFFDPMLGALIAAVAAAVAIWLVKRYGKEREDTIIGVIWAFGMSAGLLLLAITPGYVDLQGYLFGNILLLNRINVYLTAALAVLILLLSLCFFNPILALCFDRTFARLRGVKVEMFDLGILLITALLVVLMINVVGIVLVIAMLTLPAAVAGSFCQRFVTMMFWAVVISMINTLVGITVSFQFDFPAGPSIVMFSTLVYLAALVCRNAIKKLSSTS